MSERKYTHCENDENLFSLHDCVAKSAYFRDGVFGFELEDGFWVLTDHPDNSTNEVVRTDFSKIEFALEDGEDYDFRIYVLSKNIFGQMVCKEWTVNEFLDKINNGKYQLEFVYEYSRYNSKIFECDLRSSKKPYRKECILRISLTHINYYWNNLREDRTW